MSIEITDFHRNIVVADEIARTIEIQAPGTQGPQGEAGGGGVTEFTALTDAPASYTGAAGKYVRVNNTADGLEFATVESGVADHGSLTGLSDDDHTQYHNDSRANTWLGTKSTTNLSEGTNLYFTTARAKAAVVSDSITDGVTDVAPSQNAVFDALAGKQNSLGYTAANDTNVVHLSGNETITGLKEFDITATASDNGNNKGLKVSISEQNDSLVNNGATVGTSSTVTTQSNANRENWFILGDVKTVENDGSGNVDTIAGQLNQANQIGSGSVNAIVGAINNSYIDNASASATSLVGSANTAENINGNVTTAVGVVGEVLESGSGSNTNAIAFKVGAVQGTNKRGFLNDTAGALNEFNETEFTQGVKLTAKTASKIVATDADKKLDTPYTLSIDGTLAGNSDTNIPSEKAVKTYVDANSGGVSDHGALTGLADDDHTQYHNDSRASTWLATKSTSDLAEGTNLYHTTARAKAAAVSDSITDGITDVAPSQNAVFDALALKYNASNPSNFVDAAGAKSAAVSDTAYDATSWNSVTDVAPSKNAVRDQIETMLTSIAGKQSLDAQLTDLAGLSYSGNALKGIRVNAGETGFELATISAGYSVTTVTSTSSSPSDTSGERILLCDAATAGGNITVNFPTAVGNICKFTVKKIDSGSNTVIVDPNGPQTIDGFTTFTMYSQNDSITAVSDGSNWRRV